MNMKKIFALILALLMASTMCVIPVSAADLTGSFSYQNERITVTGANATANGLVSVYVLDASANISSVSDVSRPHVVDVFFADAAGGYTVNIFLPSSLTTGQYKVHIASGSNTWESPAFNHINNGELTGLLSNINSSATASEVESYLAPLNIALGLPDITYTSQYLFAVRPQAGFTDSQLQTEMQRSTALCLLQQGETPENLTAYANYLKDTTLNIDCLAQYQSLSDTAKPSYLAAISVMDLKTTSALEDIYGVGMIENIKEAQSWMELKNEIQGNPETTVFFTKKFAENTNFENLIYPEKVFQKLYLKKDQLTSLSALKTLFDAEVTTVYNEQLAVLEENNNNNNNVDQNPTYWGPSASGAASGGEKPEPTATPVPTPEAKPEETHRFSDTANHWAESAIDKMVDLGVVSGYPDGSFSPDTAVTRAEFVKMLCELFDVTGAAGSSFGDVAPDAWYAPYVEAVASMQVVNGDESGRFNPSASVTRQDAAVILGRFLKLQELAMGNQFTDQAQIATYASGYVSAMADIKLLNGMDDGSFSPLTETTRAQAVTMLLNAKQWIDQGGNGE